MKQETAGVVVVKNVALNEIVAKDEMKTSERGGRVSTVLAENKQ